jgi:hypothetical protein
MNFDTYHVAGGVALLAIVALYVKEMDNPDRDWSIVVRKTVKLMVFLLAPFVLLTVLTGIVEWGFWRHIFTFMKLTICKSFFTLFYISVLVFILHRLSQKKAG